MKHSKNICLLEDSLIVKELLTFTIEKNINSEVISIDLADPIENTLKCNPDIIILDYSLSNYDRELNSMNLLVQFTKLLPTVPVIMFSGQTNLSITAELLKNGAIDYISKNSKTFHDDILKSVQQSIDFVELSNQKKDQNKKTRQQLLKIIGLSLFVGTMISYILIT